MQLKIDIDEDAKEPVVTIKCKEQDALVRQLVVAFNMIDKKLTIAYGGSITEIALTDILYIESVDRKCFIYTTERVYESTYRLYEFKQRLSQYLFMQINKSCIVNVNHITSIKTYVNRRLLITLSNREQLIASRQYAAEIKSMLGVR